MLTPERSETSGRSIIVKKDFNMNGDEQLHILQTIKEEWELIQNFRALSEDVQQRIFDLIMNTGIESFEDE